MNSSKYDESEKIKYKLHRALFPDTGELELRYFEGLSTPLVPRLLEMMHEDKIAIQYNWNDEGSYMEGIDLEEYNEPTEALNWLYQALRNVCVPLVFDGRMSMTQLSGKRKRLSTTFNTVHD